MLATLTKRQGVRLVITPALIETLITDGETKIGRAFQEILASLRERRSAAEIDDLIRTGQAAELERLIRAAFSYMGNVAVELEQRAAQAVTAGLASATGSAIAYDVTGPMVVNEIVRRRRALIDGAVEAQMQAYRHIAPDLQGTTRKERAQRIIRATGLGERDLQWIDSYRQSLEAGSKGAYDRAFHDRRYKPRDSTKRPRTPEEIDRMVEAYSRKITNRRIKDIADAEALRSFNEGQFLAMEQAERNNDLAVGQRGIRWDSRGDEKVRDSHVRLNGQTKPNGSAFQGIYGAIRFPHDPQADSRETMGCRCRARPVLLT